MSNILQNNMKKIVLALGVLSLMPTSAMSQANDNTPQGYLTRGILMYDDNNYAGCVDQLTFAKAHGLTQSQTETADYYIAMSAMRSGSDDAKTLLERFVADYPSSAKRVDAQMSIGDYEFVRDNYGSALIVYNDIDDRALNAARRDDLYYRRAYSNLKLAEYDAAETDFNKLLASSQYRNAAKFYLGYIAYSKEDYDLALKLFKSVDMSVAPGNQAEYYLAQIYFVKEDYREALDMARRLLSRNDVVDRQFVAEANRVAGESLYNLGDEDNALPYLKKYAERSENPLPSALYILGVNEYCTGDYEEAVKHLTPATNEDNAMAQSAYLFIGQSYQKQGNNNSALLAFDKAYRMNFDKGVQETALYNYAVARMEGGRVPFGSSVGVFESFLKQFPESQYAATVQEYVVTGYMTENNYESALQSIEQIKNPDRKILAAKQQVLYTLGTRDFASGKTEQALSRFKEAKGLSVYNLELAKECDLWIGDCHYRRGRYEEASKAYSSYLKNASATSANRPLAYYNLGYSRFCLEQYDNALEYFDRLIQSPGNLDKTIISDAYNRAGDCYYHKTDFTKAETLYNKAYELNSATGDYALFQKALMRGYRKDYKEKIKILDRVIDKYPASGLIPSALLEKAESYIALDDNANAIETYRQLAKDYRATAQARNGLLQLAITYSGINDRKNAIKTYKEVITSYPTSEEARVASDDLKRMYAEEGNLSEYAQFINSIPNAPRLEATEIDALTFQAAEKAYLANGDVTKLVKYENDFPQGAYRSQALYYLCVTTAENGDGEKALAYADAIVDEYPDAETIEDVLAIKGEIEFAQGKGEIALKTYRELEKRASAARNFKIARLGIMRVSRDLGNHNDVIDAAGKLMVSLPRETAEMSEVQFARGYALNALGRSDEAIRQWSGLSSNTDDLYGAKSAFYLAQLYYDAGNLKKARSTVDAFINANTPHQYWLARGFILLSDINRKEGNTFEADEYLKTLRENYPGDETDIFRMIEQRLN